MFDSLFCKSITKTAFAELSLNCVTSIKVLGLAKGLMWLVVVLALSSCTGGPNLETHRNPSSIRESNKVVSSEPDIQIWARGKDAEKHFEGLNAELLEQPEGEEILPRAVQQKILARVELEKSVQQWDELDRDLFFLRLREYQISDLRKLYPTLPLDKLAQAKEVLLAR